MTGDDVPVRIQVRDLVKVFGGGRGFEIVAVDRVSFHVRAGEFVALIGPSGCGKSTILNMVAGLIPATDGTILVNDAAVQTGTPTPGVGYVFQRDTVFGWRTVADNIGYGLQLAGVPARERDERVAEAIHRAGLDGFADAFPLTLSGGMRQRVALMRTLIMRPETLLMDEPFGALDTHTKLDMHQLMLEIWDQERQTVVFVTHDLGEALTLADRVVVLSARPGRLKEVFPVDLPRPRDAVALRESQEYSELFGAVWHSLGEEFRKSKAEG